MKILKILGILICTGAGVIIAIKIKRFKNKIPSIFSNKNESGTTATKAVPDEKKIQEEIPHVHQIPFDEDTAKKEFASKADSFSQLYETLFQVANGTSISNNEAIDEWGTRIHYLNDCQNVKYKWNLLFGDGNNLPVEQQKENAASFLNFILASGIKRDNDDSVIVDETTKFRYYTLNGEALVAGERMKVITPSWSVNMKIIEKGILTNRLGNSNE